ncbi:MAG: hypothetical protein ICV81_15560 [Flavisolibacter sp.]|nr:hypothetical protein [Flavisolibacter sp.]
MEKLNGLYYPQEYLCLAKESFQQPLNLYLVHNGRVVEDITKLHAFVGYCPLLFVFPSFSEINDKASIEVAFSSQMLKQGEVYKKRDVIAFLSFRKIREQSTGSGKLYYYKGVHGKHRFTSAFHQFIMQLHNQLYNRKQGNVFLKGNLYKQVQIAYAVPRKICLITAGMNGLYNLFPTDLHGQVNEGYYVISLRHEGRACQQVEAVQKIVLSDMLVSAFKRVYALGKNHMQPLKEASAFDFSPYYSDVFHLPLPQNHVAYKELQLEDSFVEGIHRLLLFKIVSSKQVIHTPETLTHVHNSYATWRHERGLPGNYFLR